MTLNEKRDLVKLIDQKKRGLLDMEWVEMGKMFNLDINSETLRKAGVGVKLVSDAAMLDSDDDMTPVMDREYLERQKIRDLNSKVNAIYRAESRSELLRETIREEIRKLPRMVVRYAPLVMGKPKQKERAGVLAIGDFHYGADIVVKGLYGEVLNRYNHEVFERRMEKLLDETVDVLRKEELDHLYVFLVGDLLDGMLRESQLMRLEYGVVESTMRLAEYMAHWLACVGERVHVTVCGVTGNHSEVRPLKSKSRDFEDENLEKIVMWYLKERLRNVPTVTVMDDCQKLKLVDVVGYSFLLLHGDGEKDIAKIAHDAVQLYSQPIDYFVCGHKHSENEFPAGVTHDGNSVIIRVPSVCGMDKYAQKKGFGGKPGAILTVMERGRGRRCIYPIQL